ncbi:LytTR family transcriptional regulator [Flavobacteriaceae bacterium AU392]|nr:LytTR family transcriptional regulator [Flavobacteriaceae bacterium]RKM85633.1 LytTR family transcriptional regulator [Flavobacteriaceae bacterium AU392]
MRKDRLYLYTFLAVTTIYILISSIAIQYLIKSSTNQLIETQLESSKREAKEFASMIGYQIKTGIDKDSIINDLRNGIDKNDIIKSIKSGINRETVRRNLQESIENTDLETGFISMFNWSGIHISHPEKKRIGQEIAPEESLVSTIGDNINPEDFYKILLDNQDTNTDEQVSRIIFQFPVIEEESDWVIGAHLNVTKILSQIQNLKNRFYVIFIIIGFVFVLGSVSIARLIGSLYEKNLEAENKKLEDEVINLAKLNKAIDKFQQKASEEKQEQELDKTKAPSTEGNLKEKGKKRILTYLRHEILPVNTEDIAYIYTENTITYVVDIKGKRSTVNSSLDELQSNFDNNLFYRANRQFIISITAIEKIIRYGNSQLKILMIPASETDIIIGKNKASEFKQWLNL